MSRYLKDETIGNYQKRTEDWIRSKEQEINNIKVPDLMEQRVAKGYYDGDLGGTPLKEMREFWKVPASSDKMIDSLIDRAKVFSAGYTGGLVGLSAQGDKAFSLVNFSDSDSAIDKGNLLYNYLTKEEQAQADKDDDYQTGTQVLGVLGGLMLGQPEIVMGAINQGTRETFQETLGFRHPDLLRNAVRRFNDDLEKTEEIKQRIELNKRALNEVKREYEQAQLSSEMFQKQIEPMINTILENTGEHAQSIPHETHMPSASNIPVNLMRGRGFNFGSYLVPEKVLYERRLAGGDNNIMRYTDIMGVRY